MAANMVIPQKCYRSRQDRVLLGVCGGIADYAGMDPVVVRLVFSIAFFIFWLGLIAYIIALIKMPLEPKQENQT